MPGDGESPLPMRLSIGLAAKAGRMKFLARAGTGLQLHRTFVVAIDGSATSMRALRLAAFIKQKADKVKIIFVKSSETSDYVALQRACEYDLKVVCGVLNGTSSVVEIPSGETLESTLAREAGKVANGILVMGSAGRHHDEGMAAKTAGTRAAGQAPMGHVAEYCMINCTRPVLLVKQSTPALSSGEGMKRRRDGSEPMVIMCAVSDGGELCNSCFDLASHFVHDGDSLKVVHVLDSDTVQTPRCVSRDARGSSVVNKFRDLCDKQSEFHDGLRTFAFQGLYKKGSIRDTLLGAADAEDVGGMPADLVVMGSVELAAAAKKTLTNLKNGSPTLGSVAAAVAKRTEAHILVVKPFG